jgi:hypothetical protein
VALAVLAVLAAPTAARRIPIAARHRSNPAIDW